MSGLFCLERKARFWTLGGGSYGLKSDVQGTGDEEIEDIYYNNYRHYSFDSVY